MHTITSGCITVLSDNMTALKILDPNFLPDPRMKNFDLVVACWALQQRGPLNGGHNMYKDIKTKKYRTSYYPKKPT
jgi:hypothetical protein